MDGQSFPTFFVRTEGAPDPKEALLRSVLTGPRCPLHPSGCPGPLHCFQLESVQEDVDGHVWTFDVLTPVAYGWILENFGSKVGKKPVPDPSGSSSSSGTEKALELTFFCSKLEERYRSAIFEQGASAVRIARALVMRDARTPAEELEFLRLDAAVEVLSELLEMTREAP